MNTTKTSAGILVSTGILAGLVLPQISVGDESMFASNSSGSLSMTFSWPAQQVGLLARSDDTESVFHTLVAAWKSERDHLVSSVEEMVASPNYQAIIGLGERAVPLLLAQLKAEGDRPDHWFVALGQLTGASPVAPQDRGRLRNMANAWIAWGQATYG